MPIQLHDLDIADYWSQDIKPSFIDDLDFYCNTPLTAPPPAVEVIIPTMGVATPLTTPSGDPWKTFEMDEDMCLSMSPPNPLGFDELPLVEWPESSPEPEDPLAVTTTADTSADIKTDVLFHDCMWAASNSGNAANSGPSRTLSRQSSTSSSDSVNSSNTAVSNTSLCSSSNTNNNKISNTNVNNNATNVVNNRTSKPANLSQSNNTGISLLANSASSGLVQTIQVPGVSGGAPMRRTGVFVQKTFGRSLLIKSRTKCENNASASCSTSSSNKINVSNNNSNSLLAVKSNNNSSVSNSSKDIVINNSVQSISPPPNAILAVVPAVPSSSSILLTPAPSVVMGSRPETPQSLPESEDEACQLDLASMLCCNLDNLRPPQGDLWDDVLAAVAQEQANGIEIPPLSSPESLPIPSPEPIPSPVSSLEDIKQEVKQEIEVKDEIDISDYEDDMLEDDDPAVPSSPEVDSNDVDDLPPTPPTSSSSPEKIPTVMNKNTLAAATNVVSDHSYDKRAWIRLEDLGVQTPSDSGASQDPESVLPTAALPIKNSLEQSSIEEELDVVSYHKSGRSSRSSSSSSEFGSPGLPTNPSAEDQEEIQEITTSKLLSASKAVSRRLRNKVGKTKRRLSDSEEYKGPTTRLTKRPRVHYRPTKSRFATDSESDSKEKRDMHNNMERMRRIDLRNSFEELKTLVPSLANKERAPKVLILQDAAGYCTDLKIQSRQLAIQVAALRKEQERLRATVSGLRRSLAACR